MSWLDFIDENSDEETESRKILKKKNLSVEDYIRLGDLTNSDIVSSNYYLRAILMLLKENKRKIKK